MDPREWSDDRSRASRAELMAKTAEGNGIRTVAETMLPNLREADLDDLIGAGRRERSADRST